jgi:hypothetical protein
MKRSGRGEMGIMEQSDTRFAFCMSIRSARNGGIGRTSPSGATFFLLHFSLPQARGGIDPGLV